MRRILRWAVSLALVAAAGAALSLAWLLRSPPLSGDRARDLEQIVAEGVAGDRSIKNCVLAVMKGDRAFQWSGAAGIRHERDHQAMTSDTPIFIASVTKLYTATIVMLLAEQGALSLDDPMAKYLPTNLIRGIHVLDGKDYSGEITIRELMSHRSGIADYYDQKASDGKSLFDLLRENPESSWTVDQAIRRARDQLKPNFAPGARTSYSDTNFLLLGKVIEAVTGRPLHLVFETRIFDPLGLKHTWLIGDQGGVSGPLDEPADVFDGEIDITRARFSPSYWADGGIVSTAEDMIVFLRALNEGRIVRPESLKQMHDWRPWRFPLQYGLGTMLFRLPGRASAATGLTPLWGHSGSTGSFLYYSPADDLYVAGTVDQTEAKAKPFFSLIRGVLKVMRSE